MNKFRHSLSYDIVIVGGGIIGSAIAYFLSSNPDYSGSVAVIEKDSTYSYGSTARSLGSIRQQFSTPENIQISQYSFEFLVNAATTLQVHDTRPEINLIESSYLILATEDGLGQLKSAHKVQLDCRAPVEFLDKDTISRKFPWLNTDDIAAACQGAGNEGWFDPYSMLIALKNKSLSLGVRYIEDEAMAVQQQNNLVTGVRLVSGTNIACGAIVNAAGAAAGGFAKLSQIPLPVSPRKRCVFSFTSAESIDDLPLVVDPAGFYVRPEGDSYLCGWTPSESDPDPDDFSLEVDYEIFDDILWPLMAHRIPRFEAIRLSRAWAGHYDYNSLDQNGIVGKHPDISNYFIATGFSGHGVQQAPAVGRAISELMIYGRLVTIDLTNLGYERVLSNSRYSEHNII